MSDHEFKAPERAGEPDEPAARMAEIRARAQAATDGPWRMRHGATTEDAIHVEFGEVLVVPDGWGWADNDWRKINADAEFIAHARSDVPWLMAEVDRLTGERDRARGLAARLEEQVARVEALAVVVANRMMATAKPSEIWAALRGEGACEGSPMCPGETHTEGCYSLAWTAADWQQCTDARCLTPCTGCARDALTEAHVAEFERLRAVATRMEALADWHETKADKAMLFPGDGNVLIATKAATVHRDAAARLRAALTEAGGE